MITAKHLTKYYGKTLAVDDVSFTITPNRVTGFLGPNGSGKSTTMRLMLGLDKGKGSTLFDGKSLTEYANPSEIVGILLDMKAFHPTRTARNHLRVLAAAAGLPDSRVDEALELVGIEDVAHKAPGTFSLGMSQRLGLAAAILAKPKYLLLDEPANGLDPEGMAWLRRFMKEYATDGRAVLVSSHLLDEVSKMAEDILVIGKGKLIAATSMEKLLSDKVSQTFIRVKQPKKLESALKKAKIRYEKSGQGLMVYDVISDKVGELAHNEGLLVYELHAKSVSLEDVFLGMTTDVQQYRTGGKSTK